MNHTNSPAKTRTAALPKLGKSATRQDPAKNGAAIDLDDGAWAPIVFGPYLVPLTRRVE
ncbi:MAG: hypothetical protein WDO13_12780 [Verrucomicrobiota bacterium]